MSGAGQEAGGGDGDGGVERAIQLYDLGDPLGWEPLGRLYPQRRTEAGPRGRAVDRHTGTGGHRVPAGGDAGAGVGGGYVEGETDHPRVTSHSPPPLVE